MAGTEGTTLFTTPENSEFYSHRRYHQLEPSKHQLRLLKLHPRRLKIDDIPRVFPQWSSRLNWLPKVSRPSSVPQPSHDIPLSKLGQSKFVMTCVAEKEGHEIVSYNRPPPGYDFVSWSTLGRLPAGWSAVEGVSPFRYAVKTIDRRTEERSWSIVPSGMRAWYYVNTYTGASTWQRPTKPAAGSPQSFAEGLICCELQEYHTVDSAKGQYTALSYCAGSADSTAMIMVDGVLFNAFANLEHSLDSVLHASAALGQDQILIWTDQVCIDQRDDQEKSHQVGMMRQIYEKARHVYIVLSDTETPQHLVEKSVSYMEEANRISELLHAGKQAHVQQSENSQGTQFSSIDLLSGIIASNPGAALVLHFIEFVFHLVHANWWSRAWVFQEFIAATRVYIVFGARFRCTWPTFRWWLELTCAKTPQLCEAIRSKLRDATVSDTSKQANKANDSSTTHKESDRRLSGFARQIAATMKLTDRPKSAPKPAATIYTPAKTINGNLQLVDRLSSHFDHSHAQRQAVIHFIRSKRRWEEAPGTMDFRALLNHAHGFRSTDPRDLVYAFMGLTGISVTIDVDYSASTSLYNVLTKATLACIACDNTLAVLAASVLRSRLRHGLRLSSWVPDWTWAKPFTPDGQEEMERHMHWDCVPFSDRVETEPVATASFKKNGKPRLCVRGVFLGRLTKIVKDGYGWSRYFATDGLPGLQVQTTAEVLLGDELWILDGGSAFFVLHDCGGSDRSLVHAAGVFKDEAKNIYNQSRRIYLSIIEDQKADRWKPSTIYLT